MGCSSHAQNNADDDRTGALVTATPRWAAISNTQAALKVAYTPLMMHTPPG